MAEPDELYTLRAQFWLGHYQLAMEEAKSVARRPMPPALKAEREEFLARCQIALGRYDKVAASAAGGGDSPGLKALALKAQFEMTVQQTTDETALQPIVDQIKTLVGSNPSDPSVQLTASQVLLKAGQTKEALQCVYNSPSNPQHLLAALQIYIKMDRPDLAKSTLDKLMRIDEESVPAQLGAVFVALACGSSTAANATHYLHSLSEQYGPSPFLLNLLACAYMQQGDYSAAYEKLKECERDHPELSATVPDTLINAIACCVHMNKMDEMADNVAQMKARHPTHPFNAGLDRVNQAFDREAIKYKV